jgi:hypothetical protein
MLLPGFCGGTIAAPALPEWMTGSSRSTAVVVTQTAAFLTTDKSNHPQTVGGPA